MAYYDYINKGLVDPAEIPLNLTTLKQWLRLDTTDTSEDNILQLLVNQAVSCFELVSKRTLMNTNWENFRSCWQSFYELRKSKFVSTTSVEYQDEDEVWQTVSSDDYYIDFNNEYSNLIFDKSYTFPDKLDQVDTIRINFVAGLAATTEDVPSDIQMALMQHVTFLYENRGDCACDDMASVPAAAMKVYQSYEIMDIC
mgnify:CR=1 FL=1